MKRASIIAIVPVIALFAVWTIPVSAPEDTPKSGGATAAAKDTPPEIQKSTKRSICSRNAMRTAP